MFDWMRKHITGIMYAIVILFIISCAAIYGIGGRRGGKAGESQDKVIAKVNGKDIRHSTVDRIAVNIAENMKRSMGYAPQDMASLRKTALDSIAMQDGIDAEIKARNLKVERKEIKAELEKIKAGFPTKEEYNSFLMRSGTSERELRDEIKRELLRRKLVQSVTDSIEVTEEQAKTFYESSKSYLFNRPAGHNLLIATFRNKAAATMAQKDIEGGAKWDKIMEAQKDSIESYTKTEEPAFIPDTMLNDAPFTALKTVAVNKVSPVIDIPRQNDKCFVAIKLGHEDAKVLSYEEVSDKVKDLLKGREADVTLAKLQRKIQEEAKIEIIDNALFEPEKADGNSEQTEKQPEQQNNK